MKSKRLNITINKSPEEIFSFYINPQNSPLWLDSFIKEETDTWPVRKGTIYRNLNVKGEWNEYTVTDYKENEIFELTSKDGNYHVRYTHRPIDNKSSELEYYEWVDKGKLEEPFTLEILNKLKILVEKK
jgi:hypothetical protein